MICDMEHFERNILTRGHLEGGTLRGGTLRGGHFEKGALGILGERGAL